MKDDSKCRKRVYCQFEVVGDYPDAQVEICKNCGKKVIYNKVKDRVDNAKYLRDHLLDTLQPYGRTGKMFHKFYGKTWKD